MTETWISLAQGPLFRISLAVCLLGLAYRLFSTIWLLRMAYNRAGDQEIPFGTVWKATLRWLWPVRIVRHRPIYSLASMLFHVGIILVPLFGVGHVALWAGALTFWPVLGAQVADILTWLMIAGMAVVLLERFFVRLVAGSDHPGRCLHPGAAAIAGRHRIPGRAPRVGAAVRRGPCCSCTCWPAIWP